MSKNKFAPKKPVPATAKIDEAFRDVPTKKLTVDLDADLHKRLKMASTMQERSMRSIIEECLSDFLDRNQ